MHACMYIQKRVTEPYLVLEMNQHLFQGGVVAVSSHIVERSLLGLAINSDTHDHSADFGAISRCRPMPDFFPFSTHLLLYFYVCAYT